MTCATQKNVEAIDQIDNLFLVAPDTEFHDFLNEIDDFKKLITIDHICNRSLNPYRNPNPELMV
jgi:hypothetical protein